MTQLLNLERDPSWGIFFILWLRWVKLGTSKGNIYRPIFLFIFLYCRQLRI